jgi:hypothetical protein
MMRTLLAAVVVLMAASTASAGWGYVAGPGVVYDYWPAAPVVYPAPYVVASPVVEPFVPAPVYVSAPLGYGPAYYPAPVVVRSRVYYYGQPVRNAVRAVLP